MLTATGLDAEKVAEWLKHVNWFFLRHSMIYFGLFELTFIYSSSNPLSMVLQLLLYVPFATDTTNEKFPVRNPQQWLQRCCYFSQCQGETHWFCLCKRTIQFNMNIHIQLLIFLCCQKLSSFCFGVSSNFGTRRQMTHSWNSASMLFRNNVQ